jgi:TPR repeat protein
MFRLTMNPLHSVVAPLVIAAAFAAPRAAIGQEVHASAAQSAHPEVYGPSAASLYAEGLELRSARDDRGAFEAFLAAAKRGHARAQQRLGEIYDKGNSVVQRDYVESIRWYQKARQQGEQIAVPLRRSFGVAGYAG